MSKTSNEWASVLLWVFDLLPKPRCFLRALLIMYSAPSGKSEAHRSQNWKKQPESMMLLNNSPASWGLKACPEPGIKKRNCFQGHLGGLVKHLPSA